MEGGVTVRAGARPTSTNSRAYTLHILVHTPAAVPATASMSEEGHFIVDEDKVR